MIARLLSESSLKISKQPESDKPQTQFLAMVSRAYHLAGCYDAPSLVGSYGALAALLSVKCLEIQMVRRRDEVLFFIVYGLLCLQRSVFLSG